MISKLNLHKYVPVGWQCAWATVSACFLGQAPVDAVQMSVLGALVIGCGVAVPCPLWYFSRRYLGEVSLPAAPPWVRLLQRARLLGAPGGAAPAVANCNALALPGLLQRNVHTILKDACHC